MAEAVAKAVPRKVPRFVRWLYAFTGVVCVALAALGAILPGLPTTIFLIAASYLFTRSCPVLERLLIENRFFAPFLKCMHKRSGMSRRAVGTALVLMWVSVIISSVLLADNSRVPVWVVPLPISAAVVGTWFIVRIGRKPTAIAGPADTSSGEAVRLTRRSS